MALYIWKGETMVRKKKFDLFPIVNAVILCGIALLTLYPFIYTLSMSLSSAAEASRIGFHLFPRQISLTAYKVVLQNENILIGYMNTIFRTVLGTIGTMVITSTFAYALSKPYLPFRKFFTFFVMFTMIFSGGLIPSYLLIKNLHLLNNRLVYILPGLISAYNVVIMKSFFRSIPESLVESARIDGAKETTIFTKIIVPLSKSVFATIGMWAAVGQWNAYFDSLLYMKDTKKQVLQLFLRRIVVEGQDDRSAAEGLTNMNFTPETVKMATIVITILPILLVYPFIQKYFVKGAMLGSVKE